MMSKTRLSAVVVLTALALPISCTKQVDPEALCETLRKCDRVGQETQQECVDDTVTTLQTLRKTPGCDAVTDAMEESAICLSDLPCSELGDHFGNGEQKCNAQLDTLPRELLDRCIR